MPTEIEMKLLNLVGFYGPVSFARLYLVASGRISDLDVFYEALHVLELGDFIRIKSGPTISLTWRGRLAVQV
jgi:hypothetical protein